MSNIPAQADETAENSANISREIKFAAAKKYLGQRLGEYPVVCMADSGGYFLALTGADC